MALLFSSVGALAVVVLAVREMDVQRRSVVGCVGGRERVGGFLGGGCSLEREDLWSAGKRGVMVGAEKGRLREKKFQLGAAVWRVER